MIATIVTQPSDPATAIRDMKPGTLAVVTECNGHRGFAVGNIVLRLFGSMNEDYVLLNLGTPMTKFSDASRKVLGRALPPGTKIMLEVN